MYKLLRVWTTDGERYGILDPGYPVPSDCDVLSAHATLADALAKADYHMESDRMFEEMESRWTLADEESC